MSEGLVHADAELIEINGLAEVIERAPSHRLHRRADRSVRGQHDDLAARGDVTQPAEAIETDHAWEAQIDDADVGPRLLGATKSILPGQGKDGAVALAVQIDRHGLRLDLFVLNDRSEEHKSEL